IPRAPFPLFYHIFYHFGELNQRFLNSWLALKKGILSALKPAEEEQAYLEQHPKIMRNVQRTRNRRAAGPLAAPEETVHPLRVCTVSSGQITAMMPGSF
ncbi:hypothetical protein, partial [Oscillibacter sp. CU971]|uniref:hypothetical protein n=1 Tax=Oscillibacter sp. CU971 TaxID=2780102 RepID=UPI00195AD934